MRSRVYAPSPGAFKNVRQMLDNSGSSASRKLTVANGLKGRLLVLEGVGALALCVLLNFDVPFTTS